LVQLGGWTVTLAEPLLLGAVIHYLTLDRALAAGMLLVSILLLWGGRLLPLGWALGLFALGWAIQFLGHSVFERRAPAFLHNLSHLLIGPLWILAKTTKRA
jgi:uncharacterized membrane protein YGL010W